MTPQPIDRLPAIGELWARGERPPGTRDQVRAWLRADSSSPDYAVVIETRYGEVRMFGYGRADEPAPGYQAIRRYPLKQFIAEWWPV